MSDCLIDRMKKKNEEKRNVNRRNRIASYISKHKHNVINKSSIHLQKKIDDDFVYCFTDQ
jgi:hypothetical protein